MTGFQFEEYGVVIAEGPHKGMLMVTRRSREAAQAYIDDPSLRQGYQLVVQQRAVAVSEWRPCTLPERTAVPGEPLPPLPDSAYPDDSTPLRPYEHVLSDDTEPGDLG
jgi:hypothetical protein